MPLRVVDRAPIGSITQGTVFCGARADSYSCSTFGVVISARCDLAHEKAASVTYVPAISLRNWACNDGMAVAAYRFRRETRGVFESLLKEAGFGSATLDTEPLEEVRDRLLVG